MDLVAKHRSADDKRGAADISGTNGADIALFGAKLGLGNTVVHISYYKEDKYNKLNLDQQAGLFDCLKTSGYIKKQKGKSKTSSTLC